MRRLRPRLTYANVVSTLCLFMLLGGTSYAVATGSIDTREIRNNTVRSGDVRNNSLRSRDVRNGALIAEDFKSGQLPAGPRGAQGATGATGASGATKVVVRLASSTPGVSDGVPEVAFVELRGLRARHRRRLGDPRLQLQRRQAGVLDPQPGRGRVDPHRLGRVVPPRERRRQRPRQDLGGLRGSLSGCATRPRGVRVDRTPSNEEAPWQRAPRQRHSPPSSEGRCCALTTPATTPRGWSSTACISAAPPRSRAAEGRPT